MFDGGEFIVTVETVNMVVTASQRKIIEEEVDKAVQAHAKSINEDNSIEIFVFRQHRGDILWSVKTCNRCNKPTLVHTDPWAEVCTVTIEPATQNVTAEFIEYCNNHKRLKQIVTWVMPDVETTYGGDDEEDDPPPRRSRHGNTNNNNSNSHKHHKFPLWEEESWEDYKKMITLYVKVAKKDPEEIFLDMINALKE